MQTLREMNADNLRKVPADAPTAFIKPISRVRSRMAIAIVLAIPMAATSRAMAPTPPKTTCSTT